MSTTEEKCIYLGLKVGELTARLDSLNKRITSETNLVGSGLSKLGERTAELEKQVGKNYEHLRGGILEVDDKANALAERLAKLEAAPVPHLVPGGHGLQPDDAFACTCFVGGSAAEPVEHDFHCPQYCPPF